MSPARSKVKPRKVVKKSKPQKLKPLNSGFLNPNSIKLAVAVGGLILLSLIPVVGLVILIGVGVHHFAGAGSKAKSRRR